MRENGESMHKFHDPALGKLAALAESLGAEMKSKAPAQQSQQMAPGQLFRVPGMTAKPRFVEETGPCAEGTVITLNQGAAVQAPFQKFQTLDIDRGFFLELDFITTFTAGSGKTLTVNPFSIASWVQVLQIQFESAYSTFRLPGVLAIIMQSYRSELAPKNMLSSLFQDGANPNPGNEFAASWFDTSELATPSLALNVTTAGTQQTYSMFLEIPVAMYFDLYWELSASGQPTGPPTPRAIVSPQRMAATTRNVTPKLTLSQGLTIEPGDLLQGGPVFAASSDSTSTFAGTVAATWFRDCWIPSQNPLTEPPNRQWQYSRDYIKWQTSGGGIVPVTLDDEVPGQGQILSLVFATWDPALNSGIGGVTPRSSYATVELLYGSTVQIDQDTPKSNQYRWGVAHGAVLPVGWMGWDKMLTDDGRLTNENALNTYVLAGTQLRITYNSGSAPGASAYVLVGLEMLKKVGS